MIEDEQRLKQKKVQRSHAELSQIDFRWIQSKPGGPSISWSRPTEEAWVTIISRHTQLLTYLNDEVTILLFTSPCLMKHIGRGGTWILKQYFGGKCCWWLGSAVVKLLGVQENTATTTGICNGFLADTTFVYHKYFAIITSWSCYAMSWGEVSYYRNGKGTILK